MDKSILDDYIDACAAIEETEKEIAKIKAKRKTIVQSVVKGSMSEFPYAAKNFHFEGMEHSVVKNPGQLRMQEAILEERKAKAEEIRGRVDEWLNTIPYRKQRLVKLKHFDRKPWEKVAEEMGRDATGEKLRKELENFLKNN